jgi:hypothetical protein
VSSADGNRRFTACSTGVAITQSPNQLGILTTILDGKMPSKDWQLDMKTQAAKCEVIILTRELFLNNRRKD